MLVVLLLLVVVLVTVLALVVVVRVMLGLLGLLVVLLVVLLLVVVLARETAVVWPLELLLAAALVTLQEPDSSYRYVGSLMPLEGVGDEGGLLLVVLALPLLPLMP